MIMKDDDESISKKKKETADEQITETPKKQKVDKRERNPARKVSND